MSSSTERTLKPSATMRFAISSMDWSSSSDNKARAWPALSTPAATLRCTSGGNFNNRNVFDTCGRERPIRLANSSWVQPKSASIWEYAAASSKAFRSARCRFSNNASRSSASSSVSRMIAGIEVSPTSRQARNLRSPATSSKLVPALRTTTGCKSPISLME